MPGGRTVESEYGTMRVFEWGPQDGQKVLLIHGVSTPCVALRDMAREFEALGCRVMLFDLFGRGFSDAPRDIPYDDRLYTTQILLALASSPLAWTGDDAFHLVGYSLGGAIAAGFVAYRPTLVRSLTLVCPGGLIRPHHVSLKSRFLHARGILPSCLMNAIVRYRLNSHQGKTNADVPEAEDLDLDIPFDKVKVLPNVKVGDVVRWQLRHNQGFPQAYRSTMGNSPIYGQHSKGWMRLAQHLKDRQGGTRMPGLTNGRVCLILAQKDPIVIAQEWIEDCIALFGERGVRYHVLDGGHEIAISRGKLVANTAMKTWSEPFQLDTGLD
ncbi:hypothetical protein CDD81_6250 [Ophiocordyceps australis]|uniref:AB hydrolase-1 domain-containing protein n=1 Tax=Ophiocordyceps australis TaxID=1399860 RepID=A0A2C5X9J0_9HYPO|nr:hypothetical protein CDD81_6250 [Ophiocordyceps australis]